MNCLTGKRFPALHENNHPCWWCFSRLFFAPRRSSRNLRRENFLRRQKSPTHPAGNALKPKLVVILVIDQMRGDYIDKFQPQWSGGLKRLVREGAWLHDAAYPYAATETCVGHATVSTGAFPATHGMVTNEWWDRKQQKEVTCTKDAAVKNIPYDSASPLHQHHHNFNAYAWRRRSENARAFFRRRIEISVRHRLPHRNYVLESARRHCYGRPSGRLRHLVGRRHRRMAHFHCVSPGSLRRRICEIPSRRRRFRQNLVSIAPESAIRKPVLWRTWLVRIALICEHDNIWPHT